MVPCDDRVTASLLTETGSFDAARHILNIVFPDMFARYFDFFIA
tara:strand:+ start:76281 stop:76412 length:132 start_codon:yes stop_codon:yes gene_type:complete